MGKGRQLPSEEPKSAPNRPTGYRAPRKDAHDLEANVDFVRKRSIPLSFDADLPFDYVCDLGGQGPE